MTQSSRRFLWLAAVTAFLSILAHGYLYNQHLALQSGEYARSLCDINEKFDCSAVSASRYAVILGVPVALWGLIANFCFLIFVGWRFLASDSKRAAMNRNLAAMTLVLLMGTFIMGSISFFVLSKFCLFCMSAYVLSFLTALFVWLALKNEPSTPFRFSDLTPLLVTGAVGVLAGFIIDSSLKNAYDPNTEAREKAEVNYVADWQAATPKDFKLMDPLVMGSSPENAKMTLVEFADFRCIHCKHAAPVIHAFVASHPDVRLEFQPWPLDGECNASIPQANGASCLLARTVWCAQKLKQKGWTAHDYIYGQPDLYATADQVRAALPEIAKACEIDAGELQKCSDSDEAKGVVRKQAEVGSSLNLPGTPTIYANKKQLSGGQSLPILQRAYNTL